MQRELRIELGRVWMAAEDVAELASGSRIELDSLPDGQADIHLGLLRIARGEPGLMDGNFCFRISAATASPGRYVPDAARPDRARDAREEGCTCNRTEAT